MAQGLLEGFSAKKESFPKQEPFLKKESFFMYSKNTCLIFFEKDPILKKILFGRKPPKIPWATKFLLKVFANFLHLLRPQSSTFSLFTYLKKI